MESKFWSQRSTSSSDSDIDTDSESETAVVTEISTEGSCCRIDVSDATDDKEDDPKHVLKSAKVKHFDEMNAMFDKLKNAAKNVNDWISMEDCFEKLNKQLEKVMCVTKREKVPSVYIKALVSLEDVLAEALENKNAKKKMTSSNAKALNVMKQKLKKNNRQYEDLISLFRENPVKSKEDSDESSETDSETSYRTDVESMMDEEDDGHEMTWDVINKKLKEVVAAWEGRELEGLSRLEQLTFLTTVPKTPAQKLEILFRLVSAQFDVNPGLSRHMPINVWEKCVRNMLVLLDILVQYPNIVVNDMAEPDENESQMGLDYNGTIRLWGNLAAFVKRIDIDHFNSLQCTDPHTNEYIERLRDEPMFFYSCSKCSRLFRESWEFQRRCKGSPKAG